MMAEMPGIMRWLPSELAYLAEPAMKYGIHHSDDEIDQFLSEATHQEMSELSLIAEKVRLTNHYPAVNAWLNKYNITEHKEAANLYFMFLLMDMAELQFDTA